MKKTKFQKYDFDYLIDPDGMEHAINLIKELADTTPDERPHPLAIKIKRVIIEPLKKFLEFEHKRTGGRGRTWNTAIKFMLAAEKVGHQLQIANGHLYFEHVDLLERRWREWIIEIGSGSYLRLKAFTGGPPKNIDALSKLMMQTAFELYKKKGRYPTATQLWYALDDDDIIQEKVKKSGDKKDWVIYWITPKDKEKTTKFNKFEERYTRLKKKLKNLKK